MGSLKNFFFFFALREVFTDVPNPAIYYFWFIFLTLVKLWHYPGDEKHLLLCYFDCPSSCKAFSSLYKRHCKRALVPMMAVFFFLVKWFAVKLNKPPKISLVQGINWLTTWPITPLEKQWSLWDIGSDPRLAYRIFFSEKYKIWCYSNRCMLCHFKPGFYFLSLISSVCCCNICFVALQETETEKLQRMKKVRNVLVLSEILKTSTYFIQLDAISVFLIITAEFVVGNLFIRSCQQ